MRRTMKVLAAAALTLPFAAPAFAQGTPTHSGWLGTFDRNADLVDRIGKRFEAETGATLRIVGMLFGEARNRATVRTQAGNPADAIRLIADWVPAVQEIGGLEPPNGYFSAERLATIPEALRDAVSVDGKLHALPRVPGPIDPHFNHNLMIEARLDPENPPQTWPGFKDAIMNFRALPDKDGAKICGIAMRTSQCPNSAQWPILINHGHGGDIHKDGEIDINAPEVAAAFQWIQDVTRAGGSPVARRRCASRNAFAQGNAGFILEGRRGRGRVERMSGGNLTVAPDGDVRAMEMQMPPDDSRKTIGNPHEMVMPALLEKTELASKFLETLIFDEKTAAMHCDVNGQLPADSLPPLKAGAVGEDEYSQVFVISLEHTHDNPWTSARFNAVTSQIAPEMQKIVAGVDVAAALDAGDKALTRPLSRN